MSTVHAPSRRRQRSAQLVNSLTVLASALALSISLSGTVAARQLIDDDQGHVLLISPRQEVLPISGAQRFEFKLRTTAGHNVLVNG